MSGEGKIYMAAWQGPDMKPVEPEVLAAVFNEWYAGYLKRHVADLELRLAKNTELLAAELAKVKERAEKADAKLARHKHLLDKISE